MKHAFSRLITFINHLLANVLSTFVERWLRKHVTGYIIIRDDEIMIYNHVGSRSICIDDRTGKIIGIDKGGRTDERSESSN